MQKIRVHNFSVSADGFGAGANQDLNNPLGIGGMDLHQWFFPTNVFQQMIGNAKGETGIDNDFALRAFVNVGACIMGRNMFGPVRENWPDDSWKGWWGENPPYHYPVYVLTNHPRKSITMQGGTTFHFVTEGIDIAFQRAKESAGSKDIQICGGVKTIQQYLKAQLIDELHIAISPIILGSGERLFENIDLIKLGYKITHHKFSDKTMHLIITNAH